MPVFTDKSKMKEAITMNENMNNTTNTTTETAIEIKRVELPANFAELKITDLRDIGLTNRRKTVDAKAALLKAGVNPAIEILDVEAVVLDAVASSAEKAEVQMKNMGLGLGLIAHYKLWETTKDAKGKVYGDRGKERYLKDRFPNYNVKTMLSYVKTGLKISLPIATQNPEYDGLEALDGLTTSVAVRALPLLETDTGKEALKEAIKAGKKLTTQELNKMVKEDKEKHKKPTDDKPDGNEANERNDNPDPSEFESLAAQKKFEKCFFAYKENDDVQITVYDAFSELSMPWLENCVKDGALAQEFVAMLYNAIKKAH